MTPERWPTVDRLFHGALERRGADRAAFLDESCAGDPALREEVESLLRHAAGSDSFLERPAIQAAAQQMAGQAVAVPVDPQIPGYTILKPLGEGGMGVVYLAEQVRPIQRQVALKLIKHGMDTRQVIARFEGERQALALMNHPHIAAVFDAGTTGDGRPYFVMEYVSGVPITDYCDRHRLSTRGRLELFRQVCSGVQHAHQKGIIHRDLKPSNVLVSEEDGRPIPKIIDFGVAKAVERSMAGRTAFTEMGVLVGTPEYMSPEQAALSPDIDTSTDVYSLGVLLYELLVGALPFDSRVLRAAGYDEMRRMIRESEPAKPSSRLTIGEQASDAAAVARQTDSARLSRQLRGDLDWITLKALEKNRRHRYSTVAAFAADIAHYLADEPVTARPPSAVYRIRKFTRRYRAAVIGVAAVVVALVAGLVASMSQHARAEHQRAEADRQRAQAVEQRAAAEAAAQEAAAQRNTAISATTEANRQRILATQEAEAAIRARGEAEYRAYVSTIVAADGEIRLNYVKEARQRLLAVPAALRGWEWHHLLLKTDTSLKTVASSAPCARPSEETSFPLTSSDDAVTTRGSRLILRRCQTLETWDGPAYTQTTWRAPGKILAISPAGEAAVAVTLPGEGRAQWQLRVTDPAAGRVLKTFGPFTVKPICAGFSRDGSRIAIGLEPLFSEIGEPLEDFFEVWDVQTSQRALRLAPKKPPLFDTRSRPAMTCMAVFTPDDSRIATSAATISVWHAQTGNPIADDPVQAGTVAQPIAWVQDGTELAVGRPTGLVDIIHLSPTPRLEQLDAGGFIQTFPPMPEGDRRLLVGSRKRFQVLSLTISRDGRWIATGREAGVDVWSVANRKLTHVLAGHTAPVIGVALDATGRLVSADTSGAVKIWAPLSDSAGAVSILPGSASAAGDPVVSRNGAVAGAAQVDGAVYAWRLADHVKTELRPGVGQFDTFRLARSLSISPDGSQVSAAELDAVGTVRTWSMPEVTSTTIPVNDNPAPGCENTQPQNKTFAVNMMAVSADGQSLAAQQGRCVVVLDRASGKILAVLKKPPAAFVFRPDGALLVTSRPVPAGQPAASVPAELILWNWRTGKTRTIPVPVPLPNDSGAWRVVISDDGRTVALLGGRPSMVSIWDANLTVELRQFAVAPDTQRVALNADGSRLASIAVDSTVRLWDTFQKQLLLILPDDDRHSGVAFTPDGQLVAGRSSGGLTVWQSQKR